MAEMTLEGNRILVVEDSLSIAMALQMRLEDAGCEVVGPCGKVADALQMTRGEHIDSAILDYRLDGETTEPVVAELRARNIGFIVITGYAKDTLPEAFSGAPVLTKPMEMETLFNALRSVLPSNSRL